MSEYARRMSRLASRIFGEVAKGTAYRNEKVVNYFSQKPLHKDSRIIDYYPPYQKIDLIFSQLRHHGLYRDEHLDFKEEMIRLRALRGKTKPKKGEGKRALNR